MYILALHSRAACALARSAARSTRANPSPVPVAIGRLLPACCNARLVSPPSPRTLTSDGSPIATRQTRTPTPRLEQEGTVDPFILRGLLVCARCGKRMTTSSRGKVERLPISPPPPEMQGLRYYRCRGSGCPNAQLVAKSIEALVPQLFAKPSPEVDEQTRIIFEHLARIWDFLIIPNRRRELVWLVKELRWDGERSKLTIIADEVGIANWVESWRRINAEIEAERAARV